MSAVTYLEAISQAIHEELPHAAARTRIPQCVGCTGAAVQFGDAGSTHSADVREHAPNIHIRPIDNDGVDSERVVIVELWPKRN